MSRNLQHQAKSEASILALFRRQWFARGDPIDPSTDLSSKTAIVTAANGGLGLEVARQLCRLRLGRIVITARSQAKVDGAAQKLRAEFPKTKVDVRLLDMNSYASVVAFAESCDKDLARVDFVLLNAGVQSGVYEANPETGHETDVQVNHLSAALLAVLLVPVLRSKKAAGQAAPPVLSIVASDTAYQASLKDTNNIIAAMDAPENFSRMANYSGSKLLIVMFVAALAARVDARDVVVHTSNPGITAGTSLTQHNRTLAIKILEQVGRLLARSLAAGAHILVDGLLRKGDAESHGSFVSDWTIKPYDSLPPFSCA